MATFGDLKAQVASDLRRSNLPNEIAEAILSAIRDHGTERFFFNEATIYTLTTIPGIDDYALAPQAPILEFVMVDEVRAKVGNTWYALERETMDTIEALFSVPTTGQPFRYAVHDDNEIRFFPTPNAAFPIRIFGHYRLIELVNNADSNEWTNQGKNLIRYSALKRLFTFPIRDQGQQQAAEAAEVRELDYLRRETDRRARSGQMAAYYG